MLLNGKDLLNVANENNFAIAAFNVADYQMFNGIIEISEKKNSPVIIAIHPNEIALLGYPVLQAIRARANASSVPVAIHLDHGATYEQAIGAIHGGYTSVMLDASMMPFDENVAITKRVADTAHMVNMSVEGELGTIGKTDDEAEDGTAEIIYTDPDDAVEFVRATGVNSLAIAIGTCHGIYPAHMKAELKLDLLKLIKAKVGVPLVLHGGSNNPDGEIGQSVTLGVNKINISSDIKVAYHDKMREVLADLGLREPNSIQPPCIEAMKTTAAQKIDLFQAGDKAKLY